MKLTNLDYPAIVLHSVNDVNEVIAIVSHAQHACDVREHRNIYDDAEHRRGAHVAGALSSRGELRCVVQRQPRSRGVSRSHDVPGPPVHDASAKVNPFFTDPCYPLLLVVRSPSAPP